MVGQRRSSQKRGVVGTVLLASVGALAFAAGATFLQARPSLGASPTGSRLARIQRSPEWQGDRFANAEPMWTDMGHAFLQALRSPPESVPQGPVPVVTQTRALLETPARSGLRITWFGHSSTLIEIDGVRVLLDPIWSERPSPVPWAGPARWYPPPLRLADVGPIDVVFISHDHYDHLDRSTVEHLARGGSRFVVPLGVGAHLNAFGVPNSQLLELDWWESAQLGPLGVVATPARHASGRINPQRDETLWAGYALFTAQHRLWYSGDTGLHDTLSAIGERLGPFDVTLIESGQYDALWPDWHLGPEQAVMAHKRVRGKVLMPVHWALFKLANHGWTEPGERILAASRCYGVEVLLPRPGEPVEPTLDQRKDRWWPKLEWSPAEDTPVVATRGGNADERVEVPPCVDP